MSEESGVASAGLGWRLRMLLREPALPILLMASVAMVIRQFAPDILLFVGTAVLVVVDAGRWDFRTASAEAGAPGRRGARLALALVAVAGTMALLPRDSRWLDAACGVIGVVALALVWNPGPAASLGRRQLAPPERWWAWPLLGLGVALVELWSFVHQPAPMVDSRVHPTISTLVEPGLDAWSARALFLWLWLLAGVWLVRRIRSWAS